MCEAWPPSVTASDSVRISGRIETVEAVTWKLWMQELVQKPGSDSQSFGQIPSYACNLHRYSAAELPHTLNLEDMGYIKSLANSDNNHSKLEIKGITEKEEKEE